MSPGEGLEAVQTVAALIPWTTLMILTDITEAVILLLEAAEEGELRIKWLIANLNEYKQKFVGFIYFLL